MFTKTREYFTNPNLFFFLFQNGGGRWACPKCRRNVTLAGKGQHKYKSCAYQELWKEEKEKTKGKSKGRTKTTSKKKNTKDSRKKLSSKRKSSKKKLPAKKRDVTSRKHT